MAAKKRPPAVTRSTKPAQPPGANGFSHLDPTGALRMVDVSAKSPTLRTAVAEAHLQLGPVIGAALKQPRTAGRNHPLPKGNVFEAARLAGILAAKRVDQLIPLCHGLPVDHIRIDFTQSGPRGGNLRIEAEARTSARTGVEMEALTAATIAALTVYDMCKALSKAITIGPIRLLRKTGGKSGTYQA